MVLAKLGSLVVLALSVVSSPLPVAEKVDALPRREEPNAEKLLGCSNWLPTVVSGLTSELLTIGVCAPEPTALVDKVVAQSALDLADDATSTTTSTVSVTRTITAVNGSIPVRPTPTLPSVVTVYRTLTVSEWTRTRTTLSLINCTRTVLASSALSIPSLVPTNPSRTLIPRPTGPTLLVRQTVSSTPRPPFPIPTSNRTTTAPGRPQRTRTIWNVTTQTWTGDLIRTRYDCSNTIAYQFTVDATTTLLYTVTAYPDTTTVVSTLSCNAFGFGIPGLPTPSRPPSPPLPTPTPIEAPPTQPVIPTVSVMRRQGPFTNSSSLAAAPTPIATPIVSSISTVVVHLTRTAYAGTTVTASVGTSVLTYVCSPTSTRLPTAVPPLSPSLPGPSLPTPSLPTPSLPTTLLPTPTLPTGSLPTASLPTASRPGDPFPTASLPTGPVPTTGLPTETLPTSGSLPTSSLPTTVLPTVLLPTTNSPTLTFSP